MAIPRELPVGIVASPTSQAGWRQTFAALAIPEYRTLWWGMIASFIAMQMGIVARGYLAYDLTGSATALGLVSLAGGLPLLGFSLIGGAVVDRVRKRGVLVRTQAGLGLLAAITAVLVHLDIIEVWHLVGLSLAQSAVMAFNMPARTAIIPELVGPQQLNNAIALNNAGQNFSRIIGPAVAGALIGLPLVGMTGTFYLMAALYVIVIWSLMRLPAGAMPKRVPGPMLDDVASGFRYIASSEVLVMLLLLAFIPLLLGMPYQMLLPVFQKDVLHVDAFGLGLLYGSVGVGALIGSLIIAALSDSQARGAILATTGLLFGASLVAFTMTTSFVPALAILAVVGLGNAAYMALNNSMMMTYTDPQYYGRVMSVYMMTFGLQPLAAMPMGTLADIFGAPATVGVAGAIVVVFIGATTALIPAYRRIH